MSMEEKGEGTTGHLADLRKGELQYSQQVFSRKRGGPGQGQQLKIRGSSSQTKCILGHRTEERPLRARREGPDKSGESRGSLRISQHVFYFYMKK